MALTTSKSKLPTKYDGSSGCVFYNDQNGYGHSYVWNPNQVIGLNGFSFPLRTYVQLEFKSQLFELNEDELLKSKITNKVEVCDQLLDSEYVELLKRLKNSRYLKNKYLKLIESKNKVALSFTIEVQKSSNTYKLTLFKGSNKKYNKVNANQTFFENIIIGGFCGYILTKAFKILVLNIYNHD